LFTMIDAWKFGFYFYIYLGVVEVALTSLVVWYALTWPRQPVVRRRGGRPSQSLE
jgi:hypothetical protein